MNRWTTWLLHTANFLVAGTGLVYAWMLYGLEPSDPFSVVHHPQQPLVQHLHVLSAPLLVFTVGSIWLSHAWKHWRRPVVERRSSGGAMILMIFPMIASGYLLQTAVGELWRNIWQWVHLATSALWLAGYGFHLLGPDRNVRRYPIDASVDTAEDATM